MIVRYNPQTAEFKTELADFYRYFETDDEAEEKILEIMICAKRQINFSIEQIQVNAHPATTGDSSLCFELRSPQTIVFVEFKWTLDRKLEAMKIDFMSLRIGDQADRNRLIPGRQKLF